MSTEHRTADNTGGLERLIYVGDLAAYRDLPISTVYDWRSRGLSPRANWFGKHLKFSVSDMWI